MMSTAPPLSLTRDQAQRLQVYLQTYRRYAFASLAPSTTRNTMLRILQAIEGKLIGMIDQPLSAFQLLLSAEEMATLKECVVELLVLYGQEPATSERNTILVDLVAFKLHLNASPGGKRYG